MARPATETVHWNEEMVLLVQRVAAQCEVRFNRALKPLNLTWQQFVVLKVLNAAGNPLAVKDLQQHMPASSCNLSRLVDKLTDRKLIVRKTSGKDRRQLEISLTAGGKSIYSAASAMVQTVISEIPPVPLDRFEWLDEWESAF
ncbi:MAG: MarR family transcriptional regulator [Bacteroidetes bacterium]|nr:MarR family transcriptional regulator [Bacteroidota bacterium]